MHTRPAHLIRICILLALLLSEPAMLSASKVPVAPGVELYVEEAGSGDALVFVPGWTMTTELFTAQLDGLADRFRVITFDPRSHGRSSKTAEGNNYDQHGRDLAALLQHLQLDGVVLIGWSSGAHDVLSYVRHHGTDRLRAVILVDEPPKAVGDPMQEWVYGPFEGYRSSFDSILHRRRENAVGLARWMVARELSEAELEMLVAESRKTPDEAALALMVDTTLLDYMPEARALDGQIPVLYMVRENWAEQARSWLDDNAPSSELVTLGSHAEHWERPLVFHRKLESFLQRLEGPTP